MRNFAWYDTRIGTCWNVGGVGRSWTFGRHGTWLELVGLLVGLWVGLVVGLLVGMGLEFELVGL
jgi:hypothetical protein